MSSGISFPSPATILLLSFFAHGLSPNISLSIWKLLTFKILWKFISERTKKIFQPTSKLSIYTSLSTAFRNLTFKASIFFSHCFLVRTIFFFPNSAIIICQKLRFFLTNKLICSLYKDRKVLHSSLLQFETRPKIKNNVKFLLIFNEFVKFCRMSQSYWKWF